jgi:hypothetical protein
VTESARKNLAVIIIVASVVAAGVYVARSVSKTVPIEQQVEQITKPEKTIGRIGEGYFNFALADTESERVLGLSGHEKLDDTDAMLFVFDNPDKHCLWMKDMRFSLDILWFDADKKLIYEKRDVSPDTYPEKLCADTPAKYVVEMTAGVAAKNQMKIGDSLDVEL